MLRILAFIGGMGGAVGLSQFPEFSQQYLQRLGGAVDGLRPAVLAFDKNAAEAGITRREALDRYLSSRDAFLQEQGAAKAVEIDRFEELDADYSALKAASPLQRLAQVYRLTDRDLVQSTWEDFRPAVPVTADGFISAGIGFGVVWFSLIACFAGLAAVVRRLWRRAPEDQIHDLEAQMQALEDQIDDLQQEGAGSARSRADRG